MRAAAPTRPAAAARRLPIQNPKSKIRNAAFTLVELMVSIALVLILILGINAIFKMASDTINAGQALSAADRENRAVQSVLYNDFATAVITDGPLLLIRSERTPAFRNREDELGDRDFDASGNEVAQERAMRTVDFDGNNREGEPAVNGELTPPLVYNSRNHRIDRIAFFARHLFRRQTGTETAAMSKFVDDGASSEAYVWLGHLDQPDFRPDQPGALTTPGRFAHDSPGELPKNDNQNNFYATDWVLGRSVIALRETPPPGQNHFNFSSTARLSPLEPGSLSASSDSRGVRDRMSWSRYDLAETSIDRFKGTLASDIQANGRSITGNPPAWFELLGGEWGGGGNARFQGYPYPDRPLTPYGVARTVPVFVRGCTQFIVEYAGDYLNQDPLTGDVTGTYVAGPAGVDGQLDFVVVQQPKHPGEAPTDVKRVRWYGMPRNTDFENDTAAGPVISGANVGNVRFMRDVVPLRDLLLAAGATIPADFFEHFDGLDPRPNYAAENAVNPNPKLVRYYAAWTPADLAKGSLARPRMIRITMTIDDPNGRMGEGQNYEYVIDLP